MNNPNTSNKKGNASKEACRDALSHTSVPQRSALEILKDEYESSNSPAYLAQVAAACQHEGQSEQEATAFILTESPYELDQEVVSAIVHDAYNGIGLPTKEQLAAQQMARQQREFFNRRYEFRRNEVKGVTEYRERKKLKTSFRPVDKSVMHNIALDAHEEGIDMWDRDVVRYIDSLRVRPYTPSTTTSTAFPVGTAGSASRSCSPVCPRPMNDGSSTPTAGSWVWWQGGSRGAHASTATS